MIKENIEKTNSVLTNTINNDTINTEAQAPSYAVNVTVATASSDGSNNMSSAISLPFNTATNGNICCPSCEVWYKFTANASAAHSNGGNGEYIISTSGNLDTLGVLYDSNGNEIDNDDDNGTGNNFIITASLEYGKTYYVRVSAYGSNIGDYSITVTYTPATTETETGKGIESAISLTLNTWEKGCICCPEGEVWYKFVAYDNVSHKTSDIVKHTITTTGSLNTRGTLYDSNGNFIVLDDSDGGGNNFKIYEKLTIGETYYVKVEASGEDVGEYCICVSASVGVESIAINNTEPIVVKRGETLQLSATAFPEYATNKSIVWLVDNLYYADISIFTGVFTAKKVGVVTVTALSNDDRSVKATCTVNIEPRFADELIVNGFVDVSNIISSGDGFYMMTTPLSSILNAAGIYELSENYYGSETRSVIGFYDDWYIYAIESNGGYVYSLLKMREQESDASYENDEDNPGVTVPFISFDYDLLLSLLDEDTSYKRYRFLLALEKVTGPGYEENIHNEIIVGYFEKVESKAAYLIADEYIKLVVEKCCVNGVIQSPKNYIALRERMDEILTLLSDNVFLDNETRLVLMNEYESLNRVHSALLVNNNEAGYNIYNDTDRTINIADPKELSLFEKYAIMITHTANVTFNSFAAEVQFHAEAVYDWKSHVYILGKGFQWYEAAIRADMAIGEEKESGYADEYYDLDSGIVKAQIATHGEY